MKRRENSNAVLKRHLRPEHLKLGHINQALAASFPFKLHLRSDLHLTRKAWHMLMGLFIVGVYLAGVSRSAGILMLGSVLGLDLMLETARLRIPSLNAKILKVWGPLMRSCEVNRLSGTPYYIAAAILAIAIFPKPIAVLSIAYLACGDPIASLFGILYGDRSVRFSNGKSLIGTLAGVVACIIVSVVFLQNLQLSDGKLVALSLIGGIAGGAAELLPLEVDDNFAIPIVSGFGLWLAFIILGV